MATCKGCGAQIIWCVTVSGKKQPYDAKPEKRGVIALFQPGTREPPTMRIEDTYLPHHASCPEVERFRKDKNATS